MTEGDPQLEPPEKLWRRLINPETEKYLSDKNLGNKGETTGLERLEEWTIDVAWEKLPEDYTSWEEYFAEMESLITKGKQRYKERKEERGQEKKKESSRK